MSNEKKTKSTGNMFHRFVDTVGRLVVCGRRKKTKGKEEEIYTPIYKLPPTTPVRYPAAPFRYLESQCFTVTEFYDKIELVKRKMAAQERSSQDRRQKILDAFTQNEKKKRHDTTTSAVDDCNDLLGKLSFMNIEQKKACGDGTATIVPPQPVE